MISIVKIAYFLATLFLATSSATGAAKKLYEQNLCPNLRVVSPEKLSFSSYEKIFICGSEDVKEWDNLPLPQVKLHLKSILQSKAYHFPRFEKRDGLFVVNTGPASYIKSIVINGRPKGLKFRKNKDLLNQRLTPTNLDKVKAWVTAKLTTHGYACPEVNVTAITDKNRVDVSVEPNGKRRLVGVEEQAYDHFDPRVLDRFYAFKMESEFNTKWLELSSRRMEQNGVVESHKFKWVCKNGDEVIARPFLVLGKPRLFRVGIGFNTEEFGILRLSWKATRIGRKASTLGASLGASFKRQAIKAYSEYYFLEPSSRFHLKPSIKLTREDEEQFETLTSEALLLGASTHDFELSSLNWELGPKFTDDRTFEGVGPDVARYLSFVSLSSWMTHDYEYYQSNPRSGYKLSLLTEFVPPIISDFSVYLFTLKLKALWPIIQTYKPLLILGIRSEVTTSITPDTVTALPTHFRHYLGGINDLRGFTRNELPPGDIGNLTTFFSGIESRFTILPVEPFFFLDLGFLGNDSFSLEKTLYLSPGGGLRYLSPIGVFRASLAHGYIFGETPAGGTKGLTHLQFFLSYGQEF